MKISDTVVKGNMVKMMLVIPRLSTSGILSVSFKEFSGEKLRQTVDSFSVSGPVVPISVKFKEIKVSPFGERFDVVLISVPSDLSICQVPWKLQGQENRIILPFGCSRSVSEVTLSFGPLQYHSFILDPKQLPDSRTFIATVPHFGRISNISFVLTFGNPFASRITVFPGPFFLKKECRNTCNLFYAGLPAATNSLWKLVSTVVILHSNGAQ